MTTAPNLEVLDGDIFRSECDILVCPVCLVPGVMGAGLALEFALRWPQLKDIHRRAAENGLLRLGEPSLAWMRDETHSTWPAGCGGVLLFPTKDDYRRPSQLEWILWGLDHTAAMILPFAEDPLYRAKAQSVAVPALGCGLGRLPFDDVLALIDRAAKSTPEVEWKAYRPD